jgi:hypothetical protein
LEDVIGLIGGRFPILLLKRKEEVGVVGAVSKGEVNLIEGVALREEIKPYQK